MRAAGRERTRRHDRKCVLGFLPDGGPCAGPKGQAQGASVRALQQPADLKIIFSLLVHFLGCSMAGNLLVYGLAAAMLGILVWWAFDAWKEIQRRRRVSEALRARQGSADLPSLPAK